MDRIPEHLSIVILFWTMFETLLEELLNEGARTLPPQIREDLLTRYQGVGRRVHSLYKLLFGTTLAADFAVIGASNVYFHLLLVQDKRNSFMHGNPEVIDRDLVEQTIDYLPAFQTAWIELNNHHARQAVHRNAS